MMRKPSSRRVSGSNAPIEIDDGFASSPANIERDHGVGYDARSIVSIAVRSRSSSRLKSTLFAVVLIGQPLPNERGRGRVGWGNREVPPAAHQRRGLAGEDAKRLVREADRWRGSGGTGRFPQLGPTSPPRERTESERRS